MHVWVLGFKDTRVEKSGAGIFPNLNPGQGRMNPIFLKRSFMSISGQVVDMMCETSVSRPGCGFGVSGRPCCLHRSIFCPARVCLVPQFGALNRQTRLNRPTKPSIMDSLVVRNMGVSENRGSQCRTLNSSILIIRTPK